MSGATSVFARATASVVVQHRGGHTSFYNSAAFRLAGITKETPNPANLVAISSIWQIIDGRAMQQRDRDVINQLASHFGVGNSAPVNQPYVRFPLFNPLEYTAINMDILIALVLLRTALVISDNLILLATTRPLIVIPLLYLCR